MENPKGYITMKQYIHEKGALTEKIAKKIYVDVSLLYVICKNVLLKLIISFLLEIYRYMLTAKIYINWLKFFKLA